MLQGFPSPWEGVSACAACQKTPAWGGRCCGCLYLLWLACSPRADAFSRGGVYTSNGAVIP
jgi:hypothetical protein